MDAAVTKQRSRPLISVRAWRTIIALLIGAVAWELLGRYVITNQLFFAPLSAVAASFNKLWATGELQRHIGTSFAEFAYGLAMAAVVGVPIGVLVATNEKIHDYSEVYINALFATPLAALAPLFILWFGIGTASKVIVVFMTAVFPILINTSAGIRATEAIYLEVARSFCATRSQVYTKVLVPAALPYIVAGLRLAVGRGIVGVVVGEMFGARAGLGFLIANAGQVFDVPALFVGVVLLAFFGVATTAGVQWAERKVAPWRHQSR